MIDMNDELKFDEMDTTIQRIHSTFVHDVKEFVDFEWLISYLDFVLLNMERDKEYAGLIELFSEFGVEKHSLETTIKTLTWFQRVCP